MILADNETKVDLLNNEAIATMIVNLLQSRPDRPVTIGVHGDWGAGKSSVLEMIEAELDGVEGVLCLKFNGWRFQGFEDAKIALIEGIVTGLAEKRATSAKVASAIKDVLRRVDWLKVAKHAGSLAFTVTTGLPSPGLIQGVLGTVQSFMANPTQDGAQEKLSGAVEDLKGLLKPDRESKHVPEEINEFRKAFDKLLQEAGITQLVVLIDDLDRCLPETAIETLEAIRLFVFTSRTAFVVAADEAMVEYAVRKHFPDLPDTSGPRDYARNYLEKLIQVPFRIPPLGEMETRSYVTLLLVGAEVEDGHEGYGRLIAAARQRLQKPWESSSLAVDVVVEALGEDDDRVRQAVMISDQIGPILATGTSGNPRQVKRFLNTLLLRERTAEARGFRADVKLPVLAKLMLAERFITGLYDQIASRATADTSGRCGLLAPLEAAAAAGEGRPNTTRTPSRTTGAITKPATTATEELDPVLASWLASEPIRNWTRIQPALAEIDLRPYLFVSRDRKNYFGPISALGPLAALAERLLGGALSVRGMDGELRALKIEEASKVFDALRQRILAADDFLNPPAGVDGIAALARAHPVLQANVVDLLAGLPTDRCGPWAVAGWADVVTQEPSSGRLRVLIERWAELPGASPLKTAAIAVAKIRTR